MPSVPCVDVALYLTIDGGLMAKLPFRTVQWRQGGKLGSAVKPSRRRKANRAMDAISGLGLFH